MVSKGSKFSAIFVELEIMHTNCRTIYHKLASIFFTMICLRQIQKYYIYSVILTKDFGLNSENKFR
ncbi:MAG: hypothetical protein CVU05_01705 [Bacteroidetes bacterium HGW-Bacteroidetes-21]|nr:MAG: hypothetical protein CVU05_01705 [Bacteroidetes bacterium HGW-Bacteroidetes-21]